MENLGCAKGISLYDYDSHRVFRARKETNFNKSVYTFSWQNQYINNGEKYCLSYSTELDLDISLLFSILDILKDIIIRSEDEMNETYEEIIQTWFLTKEKENFYK